MSAAAADTKPYGLYALCLNDDLSKIKIGHIRTSEHKVLHQFGTRHHHQGYRLLRYWPGEQYYNMEHTVHHHKLLASNRIVCQGTGYITEWFDTTLDVIDAVVAEIVGRKAIIGLIMPNIGKVSDTGHKS